MIDIKVRKAHTQTAIAVYSTFDEKREIKAAAKREGKSMSRYLLDLHLEHIEKESNDTT